MKRSGLIALLNLEKLIGNQMHFAMQCWHLPAQNVALRFLFLKMPPNIIYRLR